MDEIARAFYETQAAFHGWWCGLLLRDVSFTRTGFVPAIGYWKPYLDEHGILTAHVDAIQHARLAAHYARLAHPELTNE